MADRPSDRELLRRVFTIWDERHSDNWFADELRPTMDAIRARLAEPEEPTLRSLVGAVPDLSGGIESVTYIRMKREIAELRADRDALVQKHFEDECNKARLEMRAELARDERDALRADLAALDPLAKLGMYYRDRALPSRSPDSLILPDGSDSPVCAAAREVLARREKEGA